MNSHNVFLYIINHYLGIRNSDFPIPMDSTAKRIPTLNQRNFFFKRSFHIAHSTISSINLIAAVEFAAN